MDERKWVKTVQALISKKFKAKRLNLRIVDGKNLPYLNEIVSYQGSEPESRRSAYETDLLILEDVSSEKWKPRVVIECKMKISAHDAIAYSEKAFNHKTVHPYLRYGILLSTLKDDSLPWRVICHGAHFDFILYWSDLVPSQTEIKDFLSIILDEVEASKNLELLLYNSRYRDRKRFTLLHRPLRLK